MNLNKFFTTLMVIAAGALPFLSQTVHSAAMPDKASAQTKLGLYVTAQEAWAMMQSDDSVLLIDVRDPVEAKFTGFATATDIHVPLMIADFTEWSVKQESWAMKKNPNFMAELTHRLKEQGATMETKIIVMCRSGSTRSAPVVDLLADQGYQQVWTVVDGFEGTTLKVGDSKGVRAVDGWRNSGLPWGYKVDASVAWKPSH